MKLQITMNSGRCHIVDCDEEHTTVADWIYSNFKSPSRWVMIGQSKFVLNIDLIEKIEEI